MSFIFKKSVTAFLLPPGIFLLLILPAIFLVQKRLRLFLLGLFLLIYALSIEPTKEFLLLPLEDRYPVPTWSGMQHADAIVALGGGANENAPGIDGKGALYGESLQRVVTAYRLQTTLKKPLIIAGGTLYGQRPEAEISKEVLRRLGAQEQLLVIETRSKDTNENALFVHDICRKNNWRKIVLVTSAFHMRRSMMLFGRFFDDIVPYPAAYKSARRSYDYWSFLPGASNLEDVADAMREYLGITYYKLTLRSS